ncbi:3-deoxy-7-phosphoheptulonate synthase, partial [Chloroflexota bacterium]
MNTDATKEDIAHVVQEIKGYGLRADVSKGRYKTVIGLVGDEQKVSFDYLAALPGVKETLRIETRYKLISREYSKSFEEESEHRIIKVRNVEIGCK